MPVQSTAPSVNASVTQEVKLTPSQRRKLLLELRTMEELHTQKKALERALEIHKEKVDTIRAEVGAEKIEVEGFRVAYVQGQRKEINKQKLLTWISMDQLEEATETKPIKAYVKVSYPGSKDE